MKTINTFPDAKSLLNNAGYKATESYKTSVEKICKKSDSKWKAPAGVTNPKKDLINKSASTTVERFASDDGKDNTFKTSD